MHERIAIQLDDILNGRKAIPTWMTYGRTILCLKDQAKGNMVDNYRPISCLPLMWKMLTGIIADCMHSFLETNDMLPEEQKGCRRNCRGTKDSY